MLPFFSKKVLSSCQVINSYELWQITKTKYMIWSCRPMASSSNPCLGDKAPRWLWHMAFICVFRLAIHQFIPGATVRWYTCSPPLNASFMRDLSSDFTVSNNHTPLFISRFHEKIEMLSCIMHTFLEWDYKKCKSISKKVPIITVTETRLQICHQKAADDES